MIDDLEIPMEANDLEALRESIRKRNEHWFRMRRARSEWTKVTGHRDLINPNFWPWLEKTYGLVPEIDHQGHITEGYTVTNEKLYTLFLLKFSQ